MLSEAQEEKDLGVIFDRDLKFDKHIDTQIKKANQIHNILQRNLLNPSQPTIVQLYKSLIRPHLEYANSIWSPIYKRQSIAIEKVQRRITKNIYPLQGLCYKERLQHLDLPSLKYRRLRGDLIQCYKYIHKIDDFTIKSLKMTDNPIKTRGHPHKLSTNQKFTIFDANSFANRITNPWNSLPNHVVLASSLNKFKEYLDEFYGQAMYDYDH